MELGNHYNNNIVENKELRGCYGVADASATLATRDISTRHLFA